MHVRAPNPTATAGRPSSLRTGYSWHARFPRVLGQSFSPSPAKQAEHAQPDGKAEEDDNSHIAGKWGQLAEALFPEVLELDGDGEEEPHEGHEGANTIPADVAAHLGRIVSSNSSRPEDSPQPAFPSTSYCINCCSPLTSKPSSSGICLECGWSNERGRGKKTAVSTLLSPYATLQWSALLQAQERHQPVRPGLHPGVALGFDERMLLHRASLPPYPERPERLTAILTRLLEQGLLPLCTLQRAREATLDELHAVHSPDLVQGLAAAAAAIGAAQEMGAHSHAGHSSSGSVSSSSSSTSSSAPYGVDAGLLAQQQQQQQQQQRSSSSNAAAATAAAAKAAAATLAAAALTAAREGLSSHAAHASHAAQPSAQKGSSSHSSSAIDHSTPSIPPAGASVVRSGGPATATAMRDAIDTHSSPQTASSGTPTAAMRDAIDTQNSAPQPASSTLDAARPSTDADEANAAAGPPSVASHKSTSARTTSASLEPSSSATTTADTTPAAPSLGTHGSGPGLMEIEGKQAESTAIAPTAPSVSAHSSGPSPEEVGGKKANSTADAHATPSVSTHSSAPGAAEVKGKEEAESTADAHATPSVSAHSSGPGAAEANGIQAEQAECTADAPAAPSVGSSPCSKPDAEVEGKKAGSGVRGELAGEASQNEGSRSSVQAPFYGGILAPDTLVSAHTFQAASLAAGCSAQLARFVARGEVGSAFALVRPHGHHADHSTAQSGCYFNNAAVAARAGQDAGARRVLIVDWDVHHGQGTEAIFAEDNTVMVVSLHRADEEFYPGTGQVTDVGVRGGQGYTLNIPWQDDLVTDADYMQCMLHVVLPVAQQFQPDMVVVSAGFDAAQGDFFGQTCISPACYAHMTHMLLGLAPCLFVLEGGYNLDATARCVEACLRVMLGARPPRLTNEYGGTKRMSKAGVGACMNAMQVQGEFWPSLASLNLNGWMAVIREHQEAASSDDEGTETETEDEEWT